MKHAKKSNKTVDQTKGGYIHTYIMILIITGTYL